MTTSFVGFAARICVSGGFKRASREPRATNVCTRQVDVVATHVPSAFSPARCQHPRLLGAWGLRLRACRVR